MSTEHRARLRAQLAQTQQHSVAHDLLKAGRLVDTLGIARLRRQIDAPDLRPAHTRLFPHIEMDGTRATEIAARAGISKQAAGVLIGELEAMGAVERVPDPSDRRARLVRFKAGPEPSLLDGLEVLAGIDGELGERLGTERFGRLQADLLAVLRHLEDLQLA